MAHLLLNDPPQQGAEKMETIEIFKVSGNLLEKSCRMKVLGCVGKFGSKHMGVTCHHKRKCIDISANLFH